MMQCTAIQSKGNERNVNVMRYSDLSWFGGWMPLQKYPVDDTFSGWVLNDNNLF